MNELSYILILKIIGLSLLMYIFWNFTLFILSIFIEVPILEPGETVTDYYFMDIAGVAGALVLGLLSQLFIKFLKINKITNVFFVCSSFALLNYLIMWFITYANGTTQVVFGTWFTILPFLSIIVTPLIASALSRK